MAATDINSARGQKGHEIRAARERAGLTRTEVAVLAQCSIPSLQNIEMGVVPHRSAVLPRICAVLGLSTSEAGATNAGSAEGRQPSGELLSS